MPIASTDIDYFYSMGNTGAAGASSASTSLGGTKSTTEVTGGANNVWDNISSAEASAGRTEYRMIYVVNNHGSLTLQNAVVWVDAGSDDAQAHDLDIALDAAAVGSQSTTTIGNETTAPSGPSFANTAVSKATGLSIGNIAAGSFKGIWLKRTIDTGTTTAQTVNPSIRVEGDTAP